MTSIRVQSNNKKTTPKEAKATHKPFPYKIFPSPDIAEELPKPYEGASMRNVAIINKPNKVKKWHRKRAVSDWHAQKEVVSAEMCRMVLPRHPKTRYWKPDSKNIVKEGDDSKRQPQKVYILSETISNFQALPHLPDNNRHPDIV